MSSAKREITIETFDLTMDAFPNKRVRTIRVYLPKSYDGEKRFPVLYMHDGQNLFGDDKNSNNKWHIEKEMANLEKEGLAAIVVGIDNALTRFSELCPDIPTNLKEYSRFGLSKEFKPTGNLYAEFIMGQLKTLIDSKYMTLSDAAHTAIGGASMGGLISLYMLFKFPNIFSKAMVFSPNLIIHSEDELLHRLKSYNFSRLADSRIFIFHRGLELEALNWPLVSKVVYAMQDKVLGETDLALIYDSRQPHFETAWRKYFKEAFRYLFVEDNETVKV